MINERSTDEIWTKPLYSDRNSGSRWSNPPDCSNVSVHERRGVFAMGGSAPTSLRLNGRDVDLQRGVVAKTSGTTVTLRPQAAAVLQVLAARQGKLVSKDELVAAVWRGVAVTDDSLVQCIAEIRKALGDDRHTVVKTVLKRGYMLAVEPGAQQFWRKRSTLAAAGVLASIIAAGSLLLSSPGSARKPPSLAILPFEKSWRRDQLERLRQRPHRGHHRGLGPLSADPRRRGGPGAARASQPARSA